VIVPICATAFFAIQSRTSRLPAYTNASKVEFSVKRQRDHRVCIEVGKLLGGVDYFMSIQVSRFLSVENMGSLSTHIHVSVLETSSHSVVYNGFVFLS
jgi:hypothetical protein